MPVKGGRFRRLARLSGMAAGLAGDAVGVVATRNAAAIHRRAAERIANVLGEMKGLPHKVGQVLSVLDDALPTEYRQIYAEVLGRLQSQAPPLPWSELLAVVEADLGCGLDQVFAEVDPEPAAAASIGQVHRARLLDGRDVAIKVQYPGVSAALDADLANLDLLVGTLSFILPRGSVDHLVRDIAVRFREELDYRHEALAQQTFADIWESDRQIHVPAVVGELCGEHILVSEWAKGRDYRQALSASQAERTAWGSTIWRFSWRSVLRDGCLHGDPHPGNFIFGEGGVVSVLDYGCTQHLGDNMVAGLEDLVRVAIRGGTDAEMLDPLCRALGLPLDLEPKLSSHLLAFARAMLEPVSAPQPFAFGHDHSVKLMERATKAKLVMARTAITHGVPTPRVDGAVLLMRASVGLAAMLAQLKPCADFRAAAGMD